MTKQQRQGLRRWLGNRGFNRLDEVALLNAIERDIGFYKEHKKLGKQSSSGSIRKNLATASAASLRLSKAIDQLDGNSKMLLLDVASGHDIPDAVCQIHEALQKAHAAAITRYPRQGRRPEQERERLAAFLRQSLEMYTSAFATQTRGGIFVELLRRAFALAGEAPKDLHTLAERVLERELLTPQGDGNFMFAPYKFAQKNDR